MPDDTRIVYGARCAWWGSINQVAKLPNGLPCCPHCGSVLFEVSNEEKWWDGVRKHADPQYTQFIMWLSDKHFQSLEQAREVFDHA